MRVAVIGAGWAGCAAAVEATRLGHCVTLLEATPIAGGRARRVDVQGALLDNGQHILIGAYSETLKLMAQLGVDEHAALLRLPLVMQFVDGSGLKLPQSPFAPAPLDALIGIAQARGWSWADKASLLRTAVAWQLQRFVCPAQQCVADLCSSVSPRVMATLIEPLCVSALNTPPNRASGQVFLRVMRDALFASNGGSNLLLPRVDLSALLPNAALTWLQQHGGKVLLSARVQALAASGTGWTVTCGGTDCTGVFDRVVLACPPVEAARLAATAGTAGGDWLAHVHGLQHEAIATVYVNCKGKVNSNGAHDEANSANSANDTNTVHSMNRTPATRLSLPMLALHSSPQHPAQFVFDRGQLGGPPGLLAFVVSASAQTSAVLAQCVLVQAKVQLGLSHVQVVQTIVEKRATFACTPGLVRPSALVAPGLLACGDYIAGPYPATLEGAVRSGLAAAQQLAA